MSNKLHAGKIFPGLVLAKWYAEAAVSRVEAVFHKMGVLRGFARVVVVVVAGGILRVWAVMRCE